MPRRVLVDVHAGPHHAGEVELGRVLGEPFVRLKLPQIADIEAHVRGQTQGVEQAGVRHKVGGSDPDAFAGLENGGEVDFTNAVQIAIGAGIDHLHGIGPFAGAGLEVAGPDLVRSGRR